MTQVTPEAAEFFRQAANLIASLAGRWKDERNYENIDLYLQPLSPIANQCGVVLVAMTKRPFGVKFTVGEKRFEAFIKGRNCVYRRTA